MLKYLYKDLFTAITSLEIKATYTLASILIGSISMVALTTLLIIYDTGNTPFLWGIPVSLVIISFFVQKVFIQHFTTNNFLFILTEVTQYGIYGFLISCWVGLMDQTHEYVIVSISAVAVLIRALHPSVIAIIVFTAGYAIGLLPVELNLYLLASLIASIVIIAHTRVLMVRADRYRDLAFLDTAELRRAVRVADYHASLAHTARNMLGLCYSTNTLVDYNIDDNKVLVPALIKRLQLYFDSILGLHGSPKPLQISSLFKNIGVIYDKARIQCDIDKVAESTYLNPDIQNVIFDLVDNAYKSVLPLPSRERNIHVVISNNKYLDIDISNVTKNTVPIRPGFGIQNAVKVCVQKHSGDFKITSKNSKVTASLRLPKIMNEDISNEKMHV